MGKRDDEHAMEHFAAARDMLHFESDRLSNIFSAFLLANTVLMGFLLHVRAGRPSGGSRTHKAASTTSSSTRTD